MLILKLRNGFALCKKLISQKKVFSNLYFLQRNMYIPAITCCWMLVELSTNSQMKLISLELQEKYKKLVFFPTKQFHEILKKSWNCIFGKEGWARPGGVMKIMYFCKWKKKIDLELQKKNYNRMVKWSEKLSRGILKTEREKSFLDIQYYTEKLKSESKEFPRILNKIHDTQWAKIL